MKFKLSLLIVLLSLATGISGQESLPTIKAASDTVDIRVGNSPVLKGGWYLEPDVGSKLNYKEIKTSFITDSDSITFDIEPAATYDFIGLSNRKPHVYLTS